MFQNELKKV